MTAAQKEQIAAATVRLLRRRGQGVIVPGAMIVTAAHVVKRRDVWRFSAPHDHHLERVQTTAGQRIVADLLAVEPISDIALLGEPDGQAGEELYDASERYADILGGREPVAICADDFPLREYFLVHILSHDKGWIEARAKQVHPNGAIAVTARNQINGGTSGGPIVTDDGRLLGVVSTASVGVRGDGQCAVTMARVTMLPGPQVRTMLDPEWTIRVYRELIAKELEAR